MVTGLTHLTLRAPLHELSSLLPEWCYVHIVSPQFWRMEFLQVPETPAPEPVEDLEMQEGCPEAQIGT